MFTETLASEKRKREPFAFRNAIKLEGEDISKHFPPEKFVLGLHNGGEINGLNEYFVRQAVKEGNLDKVKQLLVEYSA